MRLANATVKFAAGKVFHTKCGKNRQSIKLEFDNGFKTDVWFDEGDPCGICEAARRYCQLRRGETVRVLVEGDKITLVTEDEDDETPPTPATTPAALSNVPAPPAKTKAQIQGLITTDDETRAQIFQELCKRAQVLKSCHTQVVSLFTGHDGACIISEEAVQKYAVTLYLNMTQYWK